MPDEYRKGFLTKISRRSVLGKRLNSTFAALIADMGGIDRVRTSQLMLIERLTFQDEILQQLEQQIAVDPVGQQDMIGRYIQACNGLMGLIRTLKLDEPKEDPIDALYGPDVPQTAPEVAP